jgi:hypothetical protein
MNFFDRVRAVKKSPELWLLEDRWFVAATYFVGVSEGDPSKPLNGFDDWAKARMGRSATSHAWQSVLFEKVNGQPQVTRCLDLDEELNQQALELLYDLLLDFEKGRQ